MNVLIPDQGLARLTARALRRRYSLRLALRGIACLALPVFLALSTVSLVRNLQIGSESRRMAQDARGVVAAGDQARDMAAALAQLEPLRLQLMKIDAWNQRRSLTVGMGLYEGERVGDALRRVYFDRLREVLLRPSRERLELDLLGSYPSTREAFNRFFARYQVYRMLIQPEHGNSGLVAAELRALWFGTTEVTESTIRQLDLIDAHTDFAWRHMPDLRDAASDLPRARESLVLRAEESIRRFWESDLYYENMIGAVNRDGRPFSTAIESAFSGVLVGAAGSKEEDLVVPYAFTSAGWQEQVLPRILGSEKELKNNWLLQEAFSDRTMDIRSELLQKYLGEHHRRWVAFLGSVDLVPAVRLAEAHTRLRNLADRHSALFRFLERTRDTMDLGGQTKGLSDSDVAAFNRAAADFRSWREFFRRQGEGDEAREPAAVYANLLGEMVQFLFRLTQEGEPLANAAAVSRQVFQSNGQGGTALESVSRQIPTLVVEGGAGSCDRALDAFLRRPVRMVWDACLRATEEFLDTQWRDIVVSEYSARLSGYPLNPEARMEASVRDFAAFFRPEGTLDRFVTEQLGDFLVEHTRRARTVLDGSLRLREQTTVAMLRGDRLRSVLFARGSSVPQAVFRLRPQQPVYVLGGGPALEGTRLRFGEQSLLYDLGAPQNREFTWSGDQFGLRAVLSLLPDGAFPDLRVEDSDWALFRLLDLSETNMQSETRFQLNWHINDQRGAFRVRVPYELTANSADNPFASGFFTFHCPPRLFH